MKGKDIVGSIQSKIVYNIWAKANNMFVVLGVAYEYIIWLWL